MTVAESLVEFKKADSSKPKSSKGNHEKVGETRAQATRRVLASLLGEKEARVARRDRTNPSHGSLSSSYVTDLTWLGNAQRGRPLVLLHQS